MSIFEHKQQFRQDVHLAINKLTPAEITAKSAAIFEQVEKSEAFQKANTILVYAALPAEVQTQEFMQRWSDKKRILLPIVHGHDLKVGEYGPLIKGSNFGIMEPEVELAQIPKIDLAIVPGIAFDKQNNRLGRGKGFYDKFLVARGIYKLGVCFDCQFFDEVPHSVVDIKMDKVVHN